MGKRTWPFLALLISGCVSIGSPALMRNMTTLPDSPEKRQEQETSARARPDADVRKPLSKRMRQIETAAATIAAVVGVFMSTSNRPSKNGEAVTITPPVFIGSGASFEEMLLLDPHHGKNKARPGEDKAEDAPPKRDYDDASVIVPWLRFDPPKR
jgi:hypothetical protein